MSGHGGNVWAAAHRWGLAPDEILDFSANLNPAGPPAGVLAAVREQAGSIRHYPEPYAATLRERLAAHLRVPPGSVAVTAGAAEAIYLVARLARFGGRVLVEHPTFSEYERAARAAGVPWAPAALLRRGDVRFLCNPNNPTGRLLPRGAVAEEADSATRSGAALVVDESFLDFVQEPDAISVAREAAAGELNLWVVGSLTKFYALPGLRLGFLIGPGGARFDGERDPWSVGALAQAAGMAALADEAYRVRTREWIGAERVYLYEGLRRLPGLQVFEPSANFILGEAPVPAALLQEHLGPRGILIRDCGNFPGLSEKHFRVAVRSRPENQRLLEALSECMK